MELRTAFLAMAFVTSTVLAGCVSDDPGESSGGVGTASGGAPPATYAGEVPSQRLPVPEYDFTTAISGDHDGIPNGHTNPLLHTDSFGLELVAYNPLTRPLEGDSPLLQDSGYISMDTWTDEVTGSRYACVAHFAGTGGFTLVDISDPASPTVISSATSGMLNSDCQFTDDGEYLVLAAYLGVLPGQKELPPPAGDAAAVGALIYDVKDKANPVLLFHDTTGTGGNGGSSAYHNVFTAKIGDVNYIFQTYTGNILALDPGATALRMVSTVEVADHDIWVGHHPVTGQWIMITGANGGTAIYDMEDPAHPEILGVWESYDGYSGWHRQWPVMETVEGHALMLVAGETGGGSTLPYTVLDFTDPTEVIELGHWEIPGDVYSPGLPDDTAANVNFFTMGPHEFEIWNGYAALGNYHAGVWLIDIGTMERAMNPVTLGFYQPHELPPTGMGTWNRPFLFNPDVWGAYVDDRGYVYTADWGSGLYVLKFDATETV